jgi:mono/diheme cytochrome c family protein
MKRSGVAHRHKVLFAALGAGALILLGVGGGFVILLSGALSTSATTQHFGITHRLLEAGLRFSVNSEAADIVVPALNDPALIERGLACYREHCAQCHGSPEHSRVDAAKGMLPTPNSLVESARVWSPAGLYVITRDGVRMTGMPAWELRLSEAGLWATVAFLVELPQLTRERYSQLHLSAAAVECPRHTEPPQPAGRRETGDVLLRQYSCHACHRIGGVVGPDTYVGPPLLDLPRRKYVAGVLPNTRENLTRFIMSPQDVSPGTFMPDLGVPEAHAREMAEFLLAQ